MVQGGNFAVDRVVNLTVDWVVKFGGIVNERETHNIHGG